MSKKKNYDLRKFAVPTLTAALIFGGLGVGSAAFAAVPPPAGGAIADMFTLAPNEIIRNYDLLANDVSTAGIDRASVGLSYEGGPVRERTIEGVGRFILNFDADGAFTGMSFYPAQNVTRDRVDLKYQWEHGGRGDGAFGEPQLVEGWIVVNFDKTAAPVEPTPEPAPGVPEIPTPVVPTPEEPVVPEPETPVVPEPETPVVPVPEEPVVPEPETPVVPVPEEPVVPEPETPVVPEPTPEPEPETPVIPEPEPEIPVVPEPTPEPGPVVPGPDEPYVPIFPAPEPETPVIPEPEPEVPEVPEVPTPEETVPTVPVTEVPEETVPEVPVTEVPEETVPEVPVTEVPTEPTPEVPGVITSTPSVPETVTGDPTVVTQTSTQEKRDQLAETAVAGGATDNTGILAAFGGVLIAGIVAMGTMLSGIRKRSNASSN